MPTDKSGAGYGNHGGDESFEDKSGQDGAKSQDYKAHDKSDPDDEQDNLEDRGD